MLPVGMMGGGGGLSASASSSSSSGLNSGPVGYTTTGPDQSGFVINYSGIATSGGLSLQWLLIAGLAWLLLRK